MKNEKTAFELSENGKFAEASELFEELGHENPSHYYHAADNAKRAGDIERAISLYERIGSSLDIDRSIILALEAGMIERALKSGEKRVLLENRIRGAIREGWTTDSDAVDYVIGAATNEMMYDSAIEVAKKYGKHEELPKLYLRTAEKASRRGEFKEAIKLAEKAGEFHVAAIYAKKAGLIDRAIKLFEKTGDFYKAAEIAFNAGDMPRAKQLYQRIFEQDKEPIYMVPLSLLVSPGEIPILEYNLHKTLRPNTPLEEVFSEKYHFLL